MKTKICGITTVEQIEWVNQFKPGYIGFVFAEKSKRLVGVDQAISMSNQLDRNNIKAVGVFVNHSIKEILDCDKAIDIIQLHGKEDNNFIKKLAEYTNKPIIKAFSIEDLIDDPVETVADYMLIDSPKAGSGQPFNWRLLQYAYMNKPYFLAGGLSPDNVIEAMSISYSTPPMCLDVSSGVESNGTKDKDKIKKFIEIVREQNGK